MHRMFCTALMVFLGFGSSALAAAGVLIGGGDSKASVKRSLNVSELPIPSSDYRRVNLRLSFDQNTLIPGSDIVVEKIEKDVRVLDTETVVVPKQ